MDHAASPPCLHHACGFGLRLECQVLSGSQVRLDVKFCQVLRGFWPFLPSLLACRTQSEVL